MIEGNLSDNFRERGPGFNFLFFVGPECNVWRDKNYLQGQRLSFLGISLKDFLAMPLGKSRFSIKLISKIIFL
jgi:hypothetical protein